LHRDENLYRFFIEKAGELTEDWYGSLDKNDTTGVYSSCDEKVITQLKQQNYQFHIHFSQLFITEESVFLKEFEKWIHQVASDDEHFRTPIQFIIREFFRTQEQYLDCLNCFISESEEIYSKEMLALWNRIIIRTFSKIITWFTAEYYNHSQIKFKAQQTIIKELSSPIISLSERTGLLPLIGDIDTERAEFIIENTLEECTKKHVNRLFIDLSGAVILDAAIVRQIFKLIDSLKLLGINCILSGIRPEMARTIVQLGLTFNDITIKSTLAKAVNIQEG
jgi:rsbT co-antagonist protein RsbR